MQTDFVHWYPLEDGAAHAPSGPGVFQIRVCDGLIRYPKGRSAMVAYGAGSDLSALVGEIAREKEKGQFLCRHQSSQAPDVLLAFVLAQFEQRFGTQPSWPV